MRLIASKPFSYGGQRLKPGDAFEARDADGKAFVAIKYATADAKQPKPAAKPSSEGEKINKPEPDHGHSYRNRRLKADD